MADNSLDPITTGGPADESLRLTEGGSATAELDAIDRALIRELQEDARRPNKALAAAVGIPESTCYQRVRSLQQQGVISGYVALIDLPKIGRPIEAMLSIRLRTHTRELVNSFIEYLMGLPGTIEIFHVSGNADFLVRIALQDVEFLRGFLLDRIAERKEVGHVETSLVFLHERKSALEPLPLPPADGPVGP